ncbi:polysaccharide lyase family 8 super-sandwich domain-containing protein [Flavobacterium weaverense]|uniref:Chondroitin-sulfate-ABC endolyase/exolyase n=1 Tax=Flavobacterium weaverense TaxID=271156 RepID=A0A3L9ZXV6_9FLAO|nr:polysaccharide lyase family 8 super-sandwich domain-containing protein [Flavobacterium weaverense]RMA71652.1 chondroitin-sulfate-ABC endolyase/exolyase [Flavobacterium weaverense]
MKQLYTLLLLLLLITTSTFAQVNTTSGSWSAIGNTILSTVFSDGDNGDGIADGALLVNGQSVVVGQGAAYTFGGAMQKGKAISISTYTYNPNLSFVSLKIELWRKNNTIYTNLNTASPNIQYASKTSPALKTVLNYTPTAGDNGGELQIRYIRNDDGATARDFAIDNLILADNITVAGSCPFTIYPDLPLITSSTVIEDQIKLSVRKFSDNYLGTSAPSIINMDNAVTAYDALNIVVSGGTINGKTLTSFQGLTFLKTFAQYLKSNPPNPDPRDIKTKFNNTVWWVSKQFCEKNVGTTPPFPIDVQLYDYEDFARPTVLVKDILDPQVQNLFAYTLYKHSEDFAHFWVPGYDSTYQQANGTIITDLVYGIGDVMLAYSLWQDTPDERYRYMRAYKRFMNRFFSYTVGSADGIKQDGTGFHHWVAYNNYMYSFNAAADILSYLSATDFQVEQENYKVFRDAFYAQYIQSNDYFFTGTPNPTGTQRTGTQAMSTAGRNPQNRTNPLSKDQFKKLAIAGGSILGLSTADPVLAGIYNRIFGVDSQFNYSTKAAFESGFFQFNHAMAGAFRYENTKTLVFTKGFSDNMWGAEAYENQNRYGRYQSYGALEVIYPGNKTDGNGQDLTINTSSSAWDWNFNPGTTVIKLPWDKLHGEWSRLDERQQKRFVGSISLKNKNSELLNAIHGNFGMFAMDFQEDANQGFKTNYSAGVKNHNSTFTFKKSNFFFDDIIVCLGSGITNSGSGSNETITTLFQRMNNKGFSVNTNGTTETSGTMSYSGASANNYFVDNYGTGFYLVSGNDNIVIKKEAQQTPNQNQTWTSSLTLSAPTNPIVDYWTGYINHGANPTNKGYEYVLKPSSNSSEMQALDLAIQSSNKPYIVHQKNATAHIVEHIAKKIWGYAFFNAATNLTYNFVNEVNGSCLLMTQFDQANSSLLLSIDNPDLGFVYQARTPKPQTTRQVTLLGEWSLSTSYPGVQLVSSNSTKTVIEFTLVDGLAKEIILTNAILSTQEFDKSGITIFPNPAKDILTINGIESNNVKTATIISMLGQQIKTVDKPGNQINVSNIQEGIYFLKLQLDDNRTVTKKLIIKK